MPETKIKTQRLLTAGCLLGAVLLLIFAPAAAFAAVAAPDRIDIYDQYGLEEGRGGTTGIPGTTNTATRHFC